MRHLRLIIPLACLVLACGSQTPSTDTSIADGVSNPFVEIGTNPQGQVSTEDFSPLMVAETADVVLGPQGAWMVVCALRTNAYSDDVDRVDVRAELTRNDGDLLGTFYYKRRPLIQGTDQLGYVMNLYLVVSSVVDTWNGKDATLLLKVGKDGKDWVSEEIPVHLNQVQTSL